jgi:23S rRNA pseudouridine2605 synthase
LSSETSSESSFDETPAEASAESQPEAQPQPETQAEPANKVRAANGGAPSGDQLAATRAAHWHQDGSALLTMEGMREWLQRSGLVLYAPRAQQLGAPAPSWVEATLGKAEAAPEVGSTDAARTLLARLTAEGAAVPLNLLGASGGLGTDLPDFVASAAVFSYIFTLRGNKAWKQAPVTSGPVKVSPLALATYEILSAKVMLSAYDLATQLGKEVTEGAVLRALMELWSQLRVIPVPQLDGSATLWELASSRFTKQIKAGANAGQPSALSALISLYLGQAVAAEESEIESFLSPLAPRSRVRDVIHALLAGRQLETLVVKGKTLLHIAGDLPQFAASKAEEAATPVVESEPGSRISKLASKPGAKIGTGLRSKPAFGKKPFGAKPAYGSKPAFGDRERRPFKRDERPAQPRFDKPWEEKPKPRFEAQEDAEEQAVPPRREFPPREDSGPRKTFSKPGTFGRKREGFGGKPSFGRSSDRGGEGRPPRRDFGDRPSGGDRPPFRARPSFGDRPSGGDRPPFRARPAFGDRGASGDRPAGGGFKRPGSYSPRPQGDRPGGGFAGKPSFGPKRDFGGKPSFGAKPFGRDRGESSEGGEAPRKTFRKFDAPRGPKPFGKATGGPRSFGAQGDRPERPKRSFDGDRPRRPFDANKPAGRPGGFAGRGDGPKKPFGPKSGFGAKPGRPGGFAKSGGPFAKFDNGKKPFRKPGAGKKTDRPSRDGGFTPTRRKRPEEGESA